MGRTQWNYDYPQVHPPHPQTQYRAEPQPTTEYGANRYSWMDACTEDQDGQQRPTANRQSSAPPLPIVPESLSVESRRNEPTAQQRLQIKTNLQNEQRSQPHGQPEPQPQPYPILSKEQEAAMYTQTNRAIQPTHQAQAQAQAQQQQEQQEQSPVHLGIPYSRGESLQKPDPVKETPDHPNYRNLIVPDMNPLSPVSPKSPKSPNRRTSFQPQTTNMTVVQPNSSNLDFTKYAPVPQHTTGGSWTHGLCSCSEPSICMTGLFCPCIVYGRTQHRLNLKSAKKDTTNMLGYKRINGACVGWALLCGINGLLSGIQRTRVRRSYEMEAGSGNVFSDCVSGCCCCCCVLAQNEKEVKAREEEGRIGNHQHGYVSPGGMTFAPPPPR